MMDMLLGQVKAGTEDWAVPANPSRMKRAMFGSSAREIARIRAVDADGNAGAQRTAIVNVIDGKQ